MKLIIMRGISGSGKSTYVRENFPEAVVCSADDYFMVDGEYIFDPAGLGEAHTECFEKCLSSVTDDEAVVVVDNTNTQRAEFTPYVMLGRQAGYDIQIVHIAVDVDIAAERNTHGVPADAVRRQHDRFEEAAPFDPAGIRVGTDSLKS